MGQEIGLCGGSRDVSRESPAEAASSQGLSRAGRLSSKVAHSRGCGLGPESSPHASLPGAAFVSSQYRGQPFLDQVIRERKAEAAMPVNSLIFEIMHFAIFC